MANKRNIKKDIDYLVYEVISDCYTFKHLFPDHDHKEADKIIDDAIEMRTELVRRVNHPEDKEDKKKVKVHYKKINEDLITRVDNYFERLNKMLADVQKEGTKPPSQPKAKKETTDTSKVTAPKKEKKKETKPKTTPKKATEKKPDKKEEKSE